MTVAVVIPFFQRTEGLLPRALRSVIGQVGVEPARIIVVDDASPVPAAAEVASLDDAAASTRIHVISQTNAGPAAARNRGLASLGPEITRVAFIDSDDVWTPHHLANATRALDAGFDFYFADLFHPGQTVSGFQRAGRIDPAAHPRIGDGGVVHEFAGDMLDQIIRGNIIGTSTVVYAFDRFREQRFDEAFYSAGEDYLFWIACARAGARFCFSSEVEAHYGYGVNVYAGSGWGTPGYLLRIHNEMRYRKRLLGMPLSSDQRSFVRQKISALRIEFASDIVHRVKHRQQVPIDVLLAQFKLDPMTLLALPHNAGQLVAQQIKRSRATR